MYSHACKLTQFRVNFLRTTNLSYGSPSSRYPPPPDNSYCSISTVDRRTFPRQLINARATATNVAFVDASASTRRLRSSFPPLLRRPFPVSALHDCRARGPVDVVLGTHYRISQHAYARTRSKLNVPRPRAFPCTAVVSRRCLLYGYDNAITSNHVLRYIARSAVRRHRCNKMPLR